MPGSRCSSSMRRATGAAALARPGAGDQDSFTLALLGAPRRAVARGAGTGSAACAGQAGCTTSARKSRQAAESESAEVEAAGEAGHVLCVEALDLDQRLIDGGHNQVF